MARGRGNWHLLSEAELTELLHALGCKPEQTSNMSKIGQIAALRTRLLMCKHRGDYPNTTVAVSAARSPSRFERLPPAPYADTRVVQVDGPRWARRESVIETSHVDHSARRSAGAARERKQEPAPRGILRNGSSRPDRAQQSQHSTALRRQRPQLSSDDLQDMEETFRQQLRQEARSPEKPGEPTAGETEQKLRWYENSVLEYGLQINSMVQQSSVADRAPEAPSLGDKIHQSTAEQLMSSLSSVREPSLHGDDLPAALQQSVSQLQAAVEGGGAPDPSANLTEQFAQMERELASAATTIDDSCRAGAVRETVDEVMAGKAPAVSLEEISNSSQISAGSAPGGTHGTSAAGLVPWLEGAGGEYFRKFDANSDGGLDRKELERAVGAFLAAGGGEDEARWSAALKATSAPSGSSSMASSVHGSEAEPEPALDAPASLAQAMASAQRQGQSEEQWAEALRQTMPNR